MICLEGKCLPVRPVRHGGSRRYRTFLLQSFGLALIRLSYRPMVGKQGIEPRSPLRHIPSRRDPRSRTAFLLNPNQADYRLPRSRDMLR